MMKRMLRFRIINVKVVEYKKYEEDVALQDSPSKTSKRMRPFRVKRPKRWAYKPRKNAACCPAQSRPLRESSKTDKG